MSAKLALKNWPLTRETPEEILQPLTFLKILVFLSFCYIRKTSISWPAACWKPDSCFCFVRKDEKRVTANFYLNLQKLYLRLFSYKIISQITIKTFATQCFFVDHLNHKIVNKATCRTHSANPRQTWSHEKLSICCDYFLMLSEFPDLSSKIFLIFFKIS